MRFLAGRFPLLLLLLLSFSAVAQPAMTPEGIRQPRILILLDGSSSMLQSWSKDQIRFKAAGKVITSLIDSIYRVNNQVEFALRVYGHQHPAQENNCTDTRQEVMFSKNNLTQMSLRLEYLHPIGVSPIAYSLKEAVTNDLVDDTRNAYSIILITDGGESCGGDICGVVESMLARKIFFKPYIISLVDNAPLRSQYACLGTYLQVSKESEMAPAINAIVDAYRPLLVLPIMTPTKPVAPVAANPAVRTIEIPAWIPAPVSGLSTLPVVIRGGLARSFRYNPLPRRIPVPAVTFPKLPPPEQVAVTNLPPKSDPPRPVAVTPAPVTPKPEPVKPPVATVVKPPVATPPKDTAKTSVVMKALPPAANTAPKTQPAKPAIPPAPKDAPFTMSTEDAKETITEIYFTDGHGRFYKTTPQLQLTDASGKVVKQFWRTIDPNGNPDPQQLPPGTYNLRIAGRGNSLMRNMVIQPNKRNKILVTVTNGSLIFRYEDAPNRPMAEFDAIVNSRDEPGPAVRQHCDAELPYPPGNYHIEVNTMPISRFNADIEFGSVTEIQIKQPGFVQVMNSNNVGRVSFYYQLGDRYVKFHTLNVTGSADAQKLRLLPGPYEVHWVKNPNMPYPAETVQKFYVKSNMLTEIELH